jgi:hypothetical protein
LISPASGAWPDYGATAENRTAPDGHTLERRGDDLVFDEHILHPGEIYTTTQWTQSLNPWLGETAGIVVKHEGRPKGSVSPEALYLSGNIREGWSASPLGLLLVGIGAGAILLTRRKPAQSG